MANSGRITTGSMPRLLQKGVDKILEHYKDTYKGVGMEVFQRIQAEKGFYEAVQLAGMGYAAIKGQGAPVQMDSVDQDWVYRWPVIAYAKAARITMEAIEDNLYEDQIPILGREIAKGLAHTKDFNMAQVLNNAFSVAGPDGSNMGATSHEIQAGGTTSNLLSPGLNMSEDAVESMVLLADQMVNPDGLPSDYETMDLIVPIQLRFETDRVVNSRYRVNTADNTISASYNQNVIKRVIPWKRLTSAQAFFLTTNAENGLLIAEKEGVKTDSFKEPTTLDVLVTAYERYIAFYADFRHVICNQGSGF